MYAAYGLDRRQFSHTNLRYSGTRRNSSRESHLLPFKDVKRPPCHSGYKLYIAKWFYKNISYVAQSAILSLEINPSDLVNIAYTLRARLVIWQEAGDMLIHNIDFPAKDCSAPVLCQKEEIHTGQELNHPHRTTHHSPHPLTASPPVTTTTTAISHQSSDDIEHVHIPHVADWPADLVS